MRSEARAVRVRLLPEEARARIVRAFARSSSPQVRIADRSFVLRSSAPRGPLEYVLRGRIDEDPLGARLVLERRLRGGVVGVTSVVVLGVIAAVALFVLVISMGRAGLTEWLGLLFLPWVLFTLGHGSLARLALARAELDALAARLERLFEDVRIARDAGPYR